MSAPYPSPHLRRITGFSLIEVLITLLLITLGILGMVSLQIRTLQYTQDSIQRNTAAMLANDLMELIRATPTGLPASSDFYKAKGADFPTAPNSCTPLPSEPSQQLGCWAEKAKISLPDASALLKDEFYICRTNTANSCTNTGTSLEIQLAWRVKAGECMESGASTDSTICHYRLRSQI
ncbi:type IV pilus assembly protein PilV [Azomonas agilis]|uniref:Type IV pilus assembly protein PilV n=1 Tax=Azomonas agilis TaxID=116849 RepID=A0A562HZ78_9GAMM|nr:type IV pilus modification protein PilV [Azomonas agilis]TWH64051.1 type IV pilus assembly protein PilV [Azomonas agilis]